MMTTEFVTNKGYDLLSKMLSGECKIKFTRVEMGDGTPQETDFKKITKLEHTVCSVEVERVIVETDKTVSITANFTNADIETEFYFREKGLYATDGNKEILFSYAYTREPEPIPTHSEALMEKRLRSICKQLQDTTGIINIEVQSGIYVTEEENKKTRTELLEKIEETKEHLDENKMSVIKGISIVNGYDFESDSPTMVPSPPNGFDSTPAVNIYNASTTKIYRHLKFGHDFHLLNKFDGSMSFSYINDSGSVVSDSHWRTTNSINVKKGDVVNVIFKEMFNVVKIVFYKTLNMRYDSQVSFNHVDKVENIIIPNEVTAIKICIGDDIDEGKNQSIGVYVNNPLCEIDQINNGLSALIYLETERLKGFNISADGRLSVDSSFDLMIAKVTSGMKVTANSSVYAFFDFKPSKSGDQSLDKLRYTTAVTQVSIPSGATYIVYRISSSDADVPCKATNLWDNVANVNNTLNDYVDRGYLCKNLFGGLPFAQKLNSIANASVLNTNKKTVTFNRQNNDNNLLYDKFKPNTQYSIILDGNVENATTKNNSIEFIYSDGTKTGIYVPTTRGKTVVVSENNKTISRLQLGWNNGASAILYYENCGIFEGVLSTNEFQAYFEPLSSVNESLQYIGKGKNILNSTLKSTSSNGITVTENNGTYTVSGTASADTVFWLHDTMTVTGINNKIKVVGCPKGGSKPTYSLSVYIKNTSGTGAYIEDTGNGYLIDTKASSLQTIRLYINIKNGTVCNNLVFKPMISEIENATYDDFVPYTGSGKNLIEDVSTLKADLPTKEYKGTTDLNTLVGNAPLTTFEVGYSDNHQNKPSGFTAGVVICFNVGQFKLQICSQYGTTNVYYRSYYANNNTWQAWTKM